MVNNLPLNDFEKLGVTIPTVYLPKDGVDLSKWSVVACDQYTSEPQYWKNVETLIGDSPSTYHLVYPEVYLEEEDTEKRIKKINDSMQGYLNEGILTPLSPGFIYVDRMTSHANSRKGLILAIDLEKYDYTKGSQTLVRATEGTVVERLPPRIKIRENASLELPHIMLLIDDPQRTVIEPLANRTADFSKIYDFDLMMDGKHIKGYHITNQDVISEILQALQHLAKPSVFHSKYGVSDNKGVLLFAVGDGNHSLASAKGHWENIKKTLSDDEKLTHPARFALVEVVNVHDDGLQFEPIHRVVFNVDSQYLLDEAVKYFNHFTCDCTIKIYSQDQMNRDEMIKAHKGNETHILPFITGKITGALCVSNPKCNLSVGTLQSFLDEYLEANPGAKVDYIHGDDVVTSLGSQEGNIGFYLPPMDKNDLFKTVILDGALPRKTFSMGEAEEKRFYLESRKIVE